MSRNIIALKYRTFKVLFTITGLFQISLLVNSCSEVKADKPQNGNEAPITLHREQYYKPEKISGIPYEFDGEVTANEKVYVNFKNGGTLEFIAKDTDSIKKGTLLAKVNATEAAANKQQITAQLTDVEHDLIKLYELQKDSIGPLNDIKKLELKKETLLASKQQANYNVGKAFVTAPFVGYITKQFKENGEVVRPTEPVLEYSSIAKKIVFTVPDYIVQQLFIGKEVKVQCNSCYAKTKPLLGEIIKVAFSPEQNGLYSVEVSFKDDHNIKEGFSITVTLHVNTKEQYAKLPLRFVDQITETMATVFIINNGKAKQIQIPLTAEYSDGIIIPSTYVNDTFILPSQLITNGISIQKK